ncbi:hypothetical protein E2553_03990 [Paraburkholderia dipogonis]|uniref:Uncharacterized protein n=1 Tax=Paraburkholderia dipogonis TaxID=1211383 RepID=A0A4Y8NBW9_9BURK|nr:hypothetical protein [Paraburkholderia dipogonis]TFE47155.1 hypothetical protein E2553_03990 [Paraburkholderia dipogonis]
MPFICENVECRAVLARKQVKPNRDHNSFYFYCPDCNTRNELIDVGAAGGPLELIQPVRQGLPHKVVATARPLEDGTYAAQLSIQKALGIKGPFAAEERWDQLGVFPDPQDAVSYAKTTAADWLGADFSH